MFYEFIALISDWARKSASFPCYSRYGPWTCSVSIKWELLGMCTVTGPIPDLLNLKLCFKKSFRPMCPLFAFYEPLLKLLGSASKTLGSCQDDLPKTPIWPCHCAAYYFQRIPVAFRTKSNFSGLIIWLVPVSRVYCPTHN